MTRTPWYWQWDVTGRLVRVLYRDIAPAVAEPVERKRVDRGAQEAML